VSPQIIQTPAGRLIIAANYPSIGKSVESAIDPITGKVFLAGSVSENKDLYAVNGTSNIYLVNSIDDSYSLWLNIPHYATASGMYGIRADGTYLYVVGRINFYGNNKEYAMTIRISDKTIVKETYLAPLTDGSKLWDLNLSTARIGWEGYDGVFGSGMWNPTHIFDYNFNLIYRHDTTGGGRDVIAGSMNSQHIFLALTPWNYEGALIGAWNYPMNNIDVFSWGEYAAQGTRSMLANETYLYYCKSFGGTTIEKAKCSDLLHVSYSGLGTSLYCFIPDYDDPTKYLMVTDKGLVDIASMTLKISKQRQAWTHMCAKERYCPTEP
jgi:hypothetical protein